MNRLTSLVLATVFVFLVASASRAASAWRTPTQKDLGEDSSWREEHQDHYLVVRGDFDGDGKKDVACLLVNDNQDRIGLFVSMAYRKNKPPLLPSAGRAKAILRSLGFRSPSQANTNRHVE